LLLSTAVFASLFNLNFTKVSSRIGFGWAELGRTTAEGARRHVRCDDE
jgi:hypothetical protein